MNHGFALLNGLASFSTIPAHKTFTRRKSGGISRRLSGGLDPKFTHSLPS